MKKNVLFLLFAITNLSLFAQSDSTNVVDTFNTVSDIAHTLIPQTKGGTIANFIITAVGALIPIVIHWFKKRKQNKI